MTLMSQVAFAVRAVFVTPKIQDLNPSLGRLGYIELEA